MSDRDTLTAHGLRVTAPRQAVLQVLRTNKYRHMSVDDIYQALLADGKRLAFATVYRVLTQFSEAGLVDKLNFNETQAVFELRGHEHHDHLICQQCGHIEEFVDAIIEQHQQAIAAKAGYKMTDHSLYIYGICPKCQASTQ